MEEGDFDYLCALLFADDGEHTYAIVDGASCDELISHLDEMEPDYWCLYAGELESDVEAAAPHLVELVRGAPFTDWLLRNMFGPHWGIVLRSPLDIRAMRKHFRTFLLVRDPSGSSLYFRYYDPRVLKNFIRIGAPEKVSRILGSAAFIVLEKEGPDSVILLIRKDGGGFSTSEYKWSELPRAIDLHAPPVEEFNGRPDMLISSEEMDAFDAIAAQDFCKRAQLHVKTLFPDDERVANPDTLAAFIETEIQAASAHGFELERDVVRYLQLSFQLGTDFPAKPWALSVLQDAALQSSEKLDLLWELASDQFTGALANT